MWHSGVSFITRSVGADAVGCRGGSHTFKEHACSTLRHTQDMVLISAHGGLRAFLQRVRIARNAERCNSQRDSVCLSVRHVPVLCPDEEDTIVLFQRLVGQSL